MLKILRKYNSIILVFGGVVLMIAFVLPQLPQMFGAGAFSQTVAVMDRENISGGEYQDLERQYRAAAIVAGDVLQFFVGEDPELGLTQADHWIMLTTLAKRNGLVGGTRDGQGLLDELAAQQAGGFDAFQEQFRTMFDQRVETARRSGLTDQQIFDSLAMFRGIRRLANTQAYYAGMSEPEAVRTFQSQAEQTTADMMWIPATDTAEARTALTPEELSEFFDQYKDLYPADSDIGIGYLRRDAARGEFLTISRERALRMVPMDELLLTRYWTRNKDRFGEDYATARAAVEQAYREEEADRLISSAVAAVLSRRELELRSYPVLERYRDLPAGYADIAEPISVYEEAARSVFDQSVNEDLWEGLVRVTPDAGDFVTEVELANAPGLGAAFYRVNDRLSVPFAKILDDLPETSEDSVFKAMLELGGSEDFSVQAGVLFGPMEDSTGNVYFVRFLEAQPESPPPSYEVVEGRLRRDLARFRALQEIEAAMPEMQRIVAEAGLEGVLRFGFPGVQPLNRVTVTPDAARPAGGGVFMPIDQPVLREAVTERVAVWDPVIEAVQYPREERVLAVSLKSSLGVAVIEIVDREAPSIPEFRGSFGRIRGAAAEQALEVTEGESILTPANLAELLNYTKVDRN